MHSRRYKLPFKGRKVLIILKVASGFQKWDCLFFLLLEMKVHNFHNIFFQKLSEASYLKKKQYVTPHHLCNPPVVSHVNQLVLCFKGFSFDLQLVGVELQ